MVRLPEHDGSSKWGLVALRCASRLNSTSLLNCASHFSSTSLLNLVGVLSLFVLAAPAGAADPGWLGFRNDTKSILIVQGVSIVNGMARQGPRHVLKPGEECWDVIIAPGNKLIHVADAKQPTQLLLRQNVLYAGTDLFFAIQSVAAGQNPARATLTPAKATTTPPVGGGVGVSAAAPTKKASSK